MDLSLVLLTVSAFFYLLAFVFHLAHFFEWTKKGMSTSFSMMRIGFLFSTFYFASQVVEQGHFVPIVNASQAMAFFSWSVAFVYLVLFNRIQTESFGLVLSPLLFIFTGIACLTAGSPGRPLPTPVNPYFTLHIINAFFAYACFSVSFAASALYLIQQYQLKHRQAGRLYHRLPALDKLESLIFQPMIWGVLLLASAVFIGFLWAKSAFGTLWIWDSKTVATLITAFVYFIILYVHYVAAVRGKRVVVFSLLAFGMVLFSFVGTRILAGGHYF